MNESDYLNQLPLGWYKSTGSEQENLQKELETEIPPDHLLFGVKVKIIAHRTGTDDVLCWHLNDPKRFTVIHLSWIMKQEINSDHPYVEVDGTFEDFLKYEDSFAS